MTQTDRDPDPTHDTRDPTADPTRDPVVVEGPDELRATLGSVLGPTPWLLVDQARVDAFADVTGDHQWIHVDPVRAADSPWGGTIAHGYLTLALCNLFLPQLIDVRGFGMGVNYGLDRLRFPAPVPVGSRIRGHGQVRDSADVAGGVQVIVRVTVEIEGTDRPGCVADTVNRWLH